MANIDAKFEGSNWAAPVPFCGNRFEFRAVGSAQNVVFSLVVLNTAVANCMWRLSSMFEGGLTPCDVVATMLQVNLGAIFNEKWLFSKVAGRSGKARSPKLKEWPVILDVMWWYAAGACEAML